MDFKASHCIATIPYLLTRGGGGGGGGGTMPLKNRRENPVYL